MESKRNYTTPQVSDLGSIEELTLAAVVGQFSDGFVLNSEVGIVPAPGPNLAPGQSNLGLGSSFPLDNR